MSYKVIPILPFEKQLKRLAKKYPSIKNDLNKLVISLKENPNQGQSLGNNCYKIRLSIQSKGKGKSGGGRLITYVFIEAEEVYLLAIYDKSEQQNISEEQIRERLRYI